MYSNLSPEAHVPISMSLHARSREGWRVFIQNGLRLILIQAVVLQAPVAADGPRQPWHRVRAWNEKGGAARLP